MLELGKKNMEEHPPASAYAHDFPARLTRASIQYRQAHCCAAWRTLRSLTTATT